MNHVVGIDLGTSNSAVASFHEGKHQVMADENGDRLTPSVVSFGKDQKILVGSDAKSQLVSNPKRTVTSIKRLIGRKIFSPEVQKSQAFVPYKIVEVEDQNVAVDIEGTLYTPQEISALILRRMKEIAELRLGSVVTEAVVTVPAYFNDNQRQSTKDACKIAGLDALRIINEPTAAALAYGFGKSLNETVAIYDLGGGTFDISILRLKGDVFEVIATAGDTFLGGDDFDDRIIDLCADAFLKRTNVDLRQIPAALPLLRANAEKAKRKLSYAEKTDIYIPHIIEKDGQPVDLQFPITRSLFQDQTKDLVQRTFTVCDEALRSCGIKAGDLDAIILVGGPTKMSIISDAVNSYFGKAPLKDHNPDEVVAIGASIQAHTLRGETDRAQPKALLLDVTPLDLGIATVGGYIDTLIEANSPIPTESSRVFSTVNDNQESVQIRIFQGKNRREENSSLLGEFEFSGFRKAAAGQVGIEVLFSINTDGIVEVSAKDKETGKTQSVNVKLSSALDETNVEKAAKRSDEHKQVKLKQEFKDATKVVLCIPSRSGNTYEEGYVRNMNVSADSFHLIQDGPKAGEKDIERARVAWLLALEDFANAPRYIDAVTHKPQLMESPLKAPLYQFRMKDGGVIYGQAELPKVKEQGFWIEPYFPFDQLPGKIYIYSSVLAEAAPL